VGGIVWESGVRGRRIKRGYNAEEWLDDLKP